jgi:hypothetical protein
VTVTGILIAGFACFWREILGFFGGLYRKFTDEASEIIHSLSTGHVARGMRSRWV